MTEQFNPSAAKKRNAKRWAGAAGCIGAAAAIAAHAASASFQGSAVINESAATNAGNLYLTLPGSGSTNRMTLTVDSLYPANVDGSTPWRERVAEVTNAGNLPLATYTITTVASANNNLSNNPGAGVVMIVDECPTSWVEGGTVAEPTYTCAGNAQQDVLGCATCGANSTPVDYDMTTGTTPYTWSTGGSPALANISTSAGAVNHLRFRFKLPYLASSADQGLSVNVTFTFDGTQRAGQSA